MKTMKRAKTKSRFEVEWTPPESVPKDENGDSILDAGKSEVRYFPTLGLAAAFARKIIAERRDFYGCLYVTKQEIERNDDISRRLGRDYLEWVNVDIWIVDSSDPNEKPQHRGMN